MVKTLAEAERDEITRKSSKIVDSRRENLVSYSSPQTEMHPHIGPPGNVRITIHGNRAHSSPSDKENEETQRTANGRYLKTFRNNESYETVKRTRPNMKSFDQVDVRRQKIDDKPRISQQVQRSRTFEVDRDVMMTADTSHRLRLKLTPRQNGILPHNGNAQAGRSPSSWFASAVTSDRGTPHSPRTRNSSIDEKLKDQKKTKKKMTQRLSLNENLGKHNNSSDQKDRFAEKRGGGKHALPHRPKASNGIVPNLPGYFNDDFVQPKGHPTTNNFGDRGRRSDGYDMTDAKTPSVQSNFVSNAKREALRTRRSNDATGKNVSSRTANPSIISQQNACSVGISGNKTMERDIRYVKERPQQTYGGKEDNGNYRENDLHIASITKTSGAEDGDDDGKGGKMFGDIRKRSRHHQDTSHRGQRVQLPTERNASPRGQNVEKQSLTQVHRAAEKGGLYRVSSEPVAIVRPKNDSSDGICLRYVKNRSKKKRSREMAADSELIYPVDNTVRDTIRNLDSYLKEQDPDCLSATSSQFTSELHELVVYPQRPELNYF